MCYVKTNCCIVVIQRRYARRSIKDMPFVSVVGIPETSIKEIKPLLLFAGWENEDARSGE